MLNEYNKQKMIEAGYDLDFIARTQPEGNFKVHPGYIQQGNTFIAYVDIYKYPTSDLPLFWLSGIINNSDINMISFTSIGNTDPDKIRKDFNNAMAEIDTRMDDKNVSPADKLEASSSGQELFDMFSNITHNKETIKKIHLSIMVYAPSVDILYRNIDTLRETHYGFSMSRFIGEQETSYRSMLLPTTKQEELPNKRYHPLVQSYDLGASYPFDYTSLTDEAGTYLGFTNTDGAFLFNPYLTKGNRTRSFSLVAGVVGVGKSTLLKMLNDDAFMRGQKIRNFDINGEFISNTLKQHGMIFDTNEDGNQVNMFEVFPTVVDHSGTKPAEIECFNQNVEKIKSIAHIMNPGLNYNDLNVLDSLLRDFYIVQGLWFYNPKEHMSELRILDLPHRQYPRLDDFTQYLSSQKEIRHDTDFNKSLTQIYMTFSNMEKSHPEIFNNFTSENIDNLMSKGVINFDMSKTKAQSGTNSQLFQAQFFSYLSLVASQVLNNGKNIRNKIANGELVDDNLGMNVDYFYINIDEAQNYFNPDFPDVANTLANMMEEMRKNYCSITLTFPTLEDILPSNDNANILEEKEYIKALNKIFGLLQYYHLFKLPSKDIERLKKTFKKANSISTEQLDMVINLNKYELITIIDGDTSYQWTTDLSEEQIQRYNNSSY
ncbi:hypothetical protein DY052_06050 [Apilactobacillus timberlakei]|uniref:hypothetical protein n=1 Tax=Apilactobacillus timberlakei TaxID=2008380 RepID=UPI001126AE3E|nr:hypothetical protein [Apilactobacillus timberlakei]TPR14986.1 hypothetical protein DY052_06050 [Apilactobacillus timberlakei]